MRIFGDFRGFSRVGGDSGVITHIYPPDGVFPHLTRAYPQDRVEGPAYHSRVDTWRGVLQAKHNCEERVKIQELKLAEGNAMLVSLQHISCLSGFS